MNSHSQCMESLLKSCEENAVGDKKYCGHLIEQSQKNYAQGNTTPVVVSLDSTKSSIQSIDSKDDTNSKLTIGTNCMNMLVI